MGASFPGCDCSHSNLLAHRVDRAKGVTLGEKRISRRAAMSRGDVMANLLPLLPELTEKDLQTIAKALRRKGHLTEYLHLGHAATAPEIGFLNRKEVIAALREAARTYPEVLDTIGKLQRKCRCKDSPIL